VELPFLPAVHILHSTVSFLRLDSAAPLKTPTTSRPKLLVLELWGLGDLTFSTPLLRSALEQYDVTLVGKEHARPLLAATFPRMRFIGYDAPWTAYRDKYRLWKWGWPELFGLLVRLRRERFDAAVSVRKDPRDHLVMWLAGACRRFGFPRKGSHTFLTHPLTRSKQHRVEDWRDLGRALRLDGVDGMAPHLEHGSYHSERVDMLLQGISKPLLCVHPGARIAVRRWPEEFFAYVIRKLRDELDFHLALIPDPDGYGSGLAPLADSLLPPLSVSELVDVLGRTTLLLCNDSGPGHIATACSRPAIVIFGPTDPDQFRPWGALHHLVIRDICPWRPCFDYCKFSEPYCLTKLEPERVWPDIQNYIHRLLANGSLPAEMQRRAAALA